MNEIFMLAALAQGIKALPQYLPNPPVGCVIVDNEEIVAQGYTQPLGKHHLEANALNYIPRKAFILLKMSELAFVAYLCEYSIKITVNCCI